MARQLKTPKQRAQEALDLAVRQEKRIQRKRDAAETAFEEADEAYCAAVRRRQHAEASPDLRDEDDTELPFDEEKP